MGIFFLPISSIGPIRTESPFLLFTTDQSMTDIISNYISLHGALAIFIFMALNGFFSGPPSEMVLALGGVMASVTDESLLVIILAATSGNLLGTLLLYLLGRVIGAKKIFRILDKIHSIFKNYFFTKFLPTKKKAISFSRWFKDEGAIWVGIFRCFPVVRSIISMPAGMVAMPIRTFTTWTFGGVFLWAILWVIIGYFLTEIWAKISWSISLLLFVALCISLIYIKKKLKLYIDREVLKDK